jgi:tetratricopeptide (TPR) repeat protein
MIPAGLMAQQDDNCEGQDELVNYSTLSPVQSSITKAKGWAIQNNGKWVSSPNRIPFADEKTNKSKEPSRELGQDNFISLELRKIMIKDKQYNVLIKKYRDGVYEFPILHENWESFNSLDYYVFKSELLSEILPQEIPFNQKYAVNLNAFARGTIRNFDPKREEDMIVADVQEVLSGAKVNDWNLVLAVYPIKNGDNEVVRFKLIKTFKKAYLASYFVAPDNWSKLFDKTFYEVPLHVFKSFIRNAEEYYVPVEEIADSANNLYLSYYNRGVLKYQMGDYPSAIDFFIQSLKVNPETDDFLIYSYLGNARSKMHLFNDAIGDYDKALELQPKSVMDYSDWIKNYYNRGVAKYFMDNMDGACRDWKKALEMGFGPAHDYLMKFCGEEYDYELKQ